MNITLCSAFRNSTGYLSRYFTQVGNLRTRLTKAGHSLYLVLGEGDSDDDTRAIMQRLLVDGEIVDVSHGGPIHGSVVDADRFHQLAYVGRCIWAAIPADADAVVYAEADLIWQAKTIVALIDHLAVYPAISPMIMLERAGWEGQFYDTFVFRKDGIHFGHQPPFHPSYVADRPFMVDSAGSCMAFRGDIARRIVFGEDTIFLGICEQVYAMGNNSVWVDPRLAVYHQ